jgi:integration host factor subunit beta
MTLKKSQIIDKLAAQIESNESDKQKTEIARETVNLFFDSIKDALKTGDRVEIRGFGSFNIKEYEGYTGRNPKTGDRVEVKPKRLPVFRPGRELRKIVNK